MIKALIFIILFIFLAIILIYSKKLGNKAIYIFLLLVLIIIAILIFVFFNSTNNTNLQYKPPKFDGEKIIPGEFE